jgi:hypothetical protein
LLSIGVKITTKNQRTLRQFNEVIIYKGVGMVKSAKLNRELFICLGLKSKEK